MEDETTTKLCPKSPDGKHHYESSAIQHAAMYHHCYECVFCGHPKCVVNYPDRSEKTLLDLPTDEDFKERAIDRMPGPGKWINSDKQITEITIDNSGRYDTNSVMEPQSLWMVIFNHIFKRKQLW